MSHLYFFEKDGRCTYMKTEMDGELPKYLYDPIEYNGKLTKFYLVLKWITNDTRGVNVKTLSEAGCNFVERVEDLPEGAGIVVSGYDADVNELNEAIRKGIPVIDRPCPWVRQLRTQILDTDSSSHQAIVMIDRDHMVYDCYKEKFPDDTIIVTPEDYKEQIENQRNGKPFKFMVYATFRRKDAERVIEYIKEQHDHPDNLLNGYRKSLCNWTKQGVLEEVSNEVLAQDLHEIWIIANSEGDRSTISLMKEVAESGAKAVLIKDYGDIPTKIEEHARVGVVVAPIPLPMKTQGLADAIKDRFGVTV